MEGDIFMRNIFFIVLFCFILSTNVYASGLTAQQGHAIDVLKRIEIVDREADYDYNCNLTRRECLKYICSVSGGLYIVPDSKLMNEEYFNIPDFHDIESNTEDFRIVVTAYINGILRGKISSEGKIIADMDSYITWKEAITMINRLFISNAYIGDCENDLWYDFARDIGIISNYSNYNVYNVFRLNVEQGNNYVTEADFLYVLYLSMHVPKYMNTYQGDITHFYIDDFISCSDIE